jgi:serine/threonine protein kinase
MHLLLTAPESTSKRSYTFKSDIWQAGCCLYNMIFMTSLPNDFIRINVSNPNSFYNMTQEEFEAILFPHFPQWNLVPASARDLIKGMLKLNVDERLSIKQILEHPFLSVSHDSSSTEMESNELEKSYESKLNRVLFGQKLRKHYRVSQGQSSSDVNPDNLQEMVQHFFALFDTDGDQVISLQVKTPT